MKAAREPVLRMQYRAISPKPTSNQRGTRRGFSCQKGRSIGNV